MDCILKNWKFPQKPFSETLGVKDFFVTVDYLQIV